MAAPSRRSRSSTRRARPRCRTCRPRAEQGTANLEAYTWNALFLPKDTPEPIVKKLNAAAVEAMKSPQVRERLTGLGAQIVSDDRMTPAYLGTFLKAEIEKWAAPIKAAGVQVE